MDNRYSGFMLQDIHFYFLKVYCPLSVSIFTQILRLDPEAMLEERIVFSHESRDKCQSKFVMLLLIFHTSFIVALCFTM